MTRTKSPGRERPNASPERENHERFVVSANRMLEQLRLQFEDAHAAEFALAPYTPSIFKCELMAVAQLHKWDCDGVLHLMTPALPSWREAYDSLCRRVSQEPASFFTNTVYGELFDKVLRSFFATYQFSVEFDCHFTVGRIDDDALVEALASLLWGCRTELTKTAS